MDLLTHLYFYGSAPIVVRFGEPQPAFAREEEKYGKVDENGASTP